MDTSDASSTQLLQQKKDKEALVEKLNTAFTNGEPLGLLVKQLIDSGVEMQGRNEIIMASDYAKDPKIRDAIVLFGL